MSIQRCRPISYKAQSNSNGIKYKKEPCKAKIKLTNLKNYCYL